jgi:hypothetical protein
LADDFWLGLADAFHGFEFVLDTRKELAGSAGAGFHRQVGADAGTAFSGAIAFEDPHAKFAHPKSAGGFLDLLGARKQITQRAEIVRVRFAGVARQEGVGAEENSAVQIVKSRWDDPIMQRRKIDKDENSLD